MAPPLIVRLGRLLAIAATAIALSGCEPDRSQVSLAFEHLVAIPPAHGHYQAWAIVDETPLSLTTFRIGPDGPVRLDGTPLAPLEVAHAPGRLREVFVTQEPPDDADPAPSKQEFLRGRVSGGKAILAPPIESHRYAREQGFYLLDNPVTYKDPADFNGIWFAQIVMRRYEPGLTLQEAPDGWMYAGWVLLDGQALRVGKFRSGSDNDDWSGYSGRTGATELIDPAGKPMPGEDFIANLPAGIPTGPNQPQLAGATVVVSVESAALANEEVYPGPVRLFQATIPKSPVHKQRYRFENVSDSQVPGGTAVVTGAPS